MTEDAGRIWAAALGELKLGMSQANFESYLAGTEASVFADNELTVAVPNPLVRDTLEQRFRQHILRALFDVVGRPCRLRLVAPERSSSGPDGYRLLAVETAAAGPNGHASGTAVLLSSPLREREQESKRASGGKAAFAFDSLAALKARPRELVTWLADGLLLRDGTSLWAAKPKVGKTTATRSLAWAVASGSPFWGRVVVRGSVLLASFEERREKILQHFERLAPGAEVDEAIRVHVGPAPAGDAVEALAEQIEAFTPALVIVDNIARLLHIRDFSDYGEVSEKLEPLTELARAARVHVALTHHMTKAERFDEADAILGSTAIFGAVDTALLLKRRSDGTRTVRSRQRDGEDLEEVVLAYDPETGRTELGRPIAEADRLAWRSGVVRALEQSGEALTEGALRQYVRGNNTGISDVVRELLAEGAIVRDGPGNRSGPYQYRLPLAATSADEAGAPEGRAS